ncbi:hypothetical protein B0T24DRAFT_248854 [Lasiosphaeria ovina]|uniref:Cellobiose dehydrogenase-like cytochrome domain-containing protein n=1 Tax=Lasiosphaeria ovina TaxID=92902 RepID=A0AAE0N7D6_9PEZI|nr:hypothetical protein B0T24DRAFT_248854 [Lasiosphaeria ovina]
MGLLQLAAAALALGSSAVATPVPEAEAVSAATKYCEASTSICYSEFANPAGVLYRIAIPDTATVGNFDLLLQIVAPKAIGWAGVAWGGVMTNNPLTVAWANPGATSVVSSRRASSRTYPTPFADVSYTVLPGSTSNSTHWTVTALAKGLSAWGTTKLDPASTATQFAWVTSATAPVEPANNASRFGIHTAHAKWSHDLSSSKLANFAALVQQAAAAKPATL